MAVRKHLIKCLHKSASLCLGFFLSYPVSGQISEYADCSEYYFEGAEFVLPMTQEEKVQKLEDSFYGKISDMDKCSQLSESDETRNDFGSNSAARAGSEAGTQENGQAEQTTPASTISSNKLEDGASSIAIVASKAQKPQIDSSFYAAGSSEPCFGTPRPTGSRSWRC